jgi:hypothetical protein
MVDLLFYKVLHFAYLKGLIAVRDEFLEKGEDSIIFMACTNNLLIHVRTLREYEQTLSNESLRAHYMEIIKDQAQMNVVEEMSQGKTIEQRVTSAVDQSIRDALLRDVGSLWISYCVDQNVSDNLRESFLIFLEKYTQTLIKNLK